MTTAEDVSDPHRSNGRPATLRAEAERAFRDRDYATAAAKFAELRDQGTSQQYNDVAKSKHGAAQWRMAERATVSQAERETMIRSASELLRTARQHRDPRYAARAHYERSKALWHLWRHTNVASDIHESLEAANAAAQLEPREDYLNWQGRVDRDALDDSLSWDKHEQYVTSHAEIVSAQQYAGAQI